MTWHTPRWQLMQPQAADQKGEKKKKKKSERERGKLIMSVLCGGNRAVTFPDRGDISPIRVVSATL